MKRQVSGITIIECIVYIALSALLSMMLFRWWATSQRQVNVLEGTVQQAITERLVYVLISRDIMQASPQITDWQIADKQCSFSTHQGTISYRISKGILYRVLKKVGALRSNKAVIARHVSTMQVSMETLGGLVKAISLSFVFEKDRKVSWQILLRRGIRL